MRLRSGSPFLLHAAPASPRRLHLRVYDRILLLSTLSALLERAQPTSVRLEVFNFDKQRVIYGSDDFTLKSMGEVAQALNRLELETVDVKTLQNRSGAMDLLASLIGKETASSKPSDAVVFLGPAARYIDKLPASTIEGAPGGMRFYYFQYRTFAGRPQPMIPDIISSALSSLKGGSFRSIRPGSSPMRFGNWKGWRSDEGRPPSGALWITAEHAQEIGDLPQVVQRIDRRGGVRAPEEIHIKEIFPGLSAQRPRFDLR